MNTRAHIFVGGLVQGIGFRSWVRWLARKMNLYGWAKNTDSRVEILVEGPSVVAKDFEKALWRGPVGSRVESVVSTTETYTSKLGGASLRDGEIGDRFLHKGEFSEFVVKK